MPPDNSLPDAAQAPEPSAEVQSAPPADGANSAAAPDLADQGAQAPANEGAHAGSPTASAHSRKPADERIGELVEGNKALREAAEFWRQKALSSQQAAAPQDPPPPAIKPAPTLEEFEFDTPRWAAAHAAWANEQIDARVNAGIAKQIGQARADDAQAAVERQWSERVTEFEKTEPGALDTILVAGQFVSPLMAQLVKASSVGVKIAHHLGLNPDKAARIARLPEAQQAMHIGRLEAELSASTPAPPRKPTPPPTTRAPAPPNPVGGAAAPSKALESMSIDEYLVSRLEARRARRKA